MAAVSRWIAAFGRCNAAYLAFVALLVAFGGWAEALGPHGPDAGGGVIATVLLWATVSAVFFVVNAVLLVVALATGQPAEKPMIGCGLPALCVGVPLVAEPFFVG